MNGHQHRLPPRQARPERQTAPRPQRLAALLACSLLLGLTVRTSAQGGGTPGTVAQVGTPRLTGLGGTVEVRGAGATYALAQPGQTVTGGLRTGTGRAVVSVPGGSVTLGVASTLRVTQGEPDLQQGRFLVSGLSGQEARFFTQGAHLAASGRARLDLTESLRRVAVLSGTVRVSALPGRRAVTVMAGQQLNLASGLLSAFTENDAWYDSRFEGVGDAQVQATRGTVETGSGAEGGWRPSVLGAALPEGARVRTGNSSWAELGFTGGGYLRLQEKSLLRVLGIEKTSSGREVLLQLESGSAWNVVQKKAGGYQLSTPTVTTAVRGTIFRVDAGGLVKVFDGAVALPAQGDVPLSVGEQRGAGGTRQALVPDALDQYNMALDADRARATTVSFTLPVSVQRLDLSVLSNSSSAVTAQLVPASPAPAVPGTPLEYTLTGAPQPGAGDPASAPPATRDFRLQAEPPEGRYTLTVQATRYGQSLTRSAGLRVDRTPPQLRVSSVQALGNTFIVTGETSDDSGQPPLLSAALAGADRPVGSTGAAPLAQLEAQGEFTWVLPRPAGAAAGDLIISAEDQAGNVSRAPGR